MTLVLSVFTLLLGPFVYSFGRRYAYARQFLDGFVFITIAGIVCVHIIPDALEAGGLLSIGFLALGLVFPVVLEKIFDRAMHRAHGFILLVAAMGLVIHAVLDGLALAPDPRHLDTATDPAANQLALGVVLHRLPIGMAIWWSLRPQFGMATAIAVFLLIIAGTAASYLFAAPIVEMAETRSVAYFQSFVAGSLVHVVAFGVSHTHKVHVESEVMVDAWGYRLGILIGMFVVFALPAVHGI